MQNQTVEEYIAQYCDQSWVAFYALYKEQFENAPAGQSRHHNFTGGLAVHTAEVIRAMLEIKRALSVKSLIGQGGHPQVDSIQCKEMDFSEADIVIAGFLHDFAKIVQYKQDEMGDWRYVDMSMPQETWTLMTLAQHGVHVSEDQTRALLYAEGGFSEFLSKGRPNELAWLLHMADIWSSQIICPTVKLPSCPRCGKDMIKRNGSRGIFWGCSGYPVCTSTMNIA